MSDPSLSAADLPHHEHPTRMVTGRFIIVTLATFAYFLALGSLLPTLPEYVEHDLGGDGFAVGLVVGSFAVAAALVRPWAGRLGDRRGRRILLSGGAFIVAVTTLAYTQVDSIALLVVLRLITGLGEAAVFVGAATAVQDLAPDERRGEAASYFSVALYSGLALGPALGEHIAGQYGYDEVWIAAAFATLVAATLGLWTPNRADPDYSKPDSLLHRSALGPGLVLMLGLIPFTAFAAFLAVYGEDIGLENTAPVFFAYAAVVLLIRIFGAKLPDRLGWRTASTLALASVGIAALVIALWASVAAVWLAAIALGPRHVAALPGALLGCLAGRARERTQSGGRHVLAVLRLVPRSRCAPSRRRGGAHLRAGRVRRRRHRRCRRLLGPAQSAVPSNPDGRRRPVALTAAARSCGHLTMIHQMVKYLHDG